MDSSIYGADVGFGQLPYPMSCGILPVSANSLTLLRRQCWRKGELDSYRHQKAGLVIEENSSGSISLPVRQGVDLINKWQKHVMVVEYEQPFLLHSLHNKAFKENVEPFLRKV